MFCTEAQRGILEGMEQRRENQTDAEQAVLDEASKVNEERMDAVQRLASSVARRVELERQVSEAVKEEKRLATAAEKAGWTAAQVKRFAKKAKEQPQKKGHPNPQHQAEESAQPSESEQPLHQEGLHRENEDRS